MIMSSRRSRLLCALLLLAQLGLGQMWAGAQAETNALQFETAIRAFEKADQTSPPPTIRYRGTARRASEPGFLS